MKKKYIVLTSIFIGFSIFATACGATPEPTPTIDTNALMTEVAMTVEAEVTQAAALTPSATTPVEPTPTLPVVATQDLASSITQPAPTLPVAATSAGVTAASPTGDDVIWVEDVTVPDGEIYYEREFFKKVWKVKNTGTTTWDSGYALVNIDGNNWDEDIIVPLTETVVPGAEVNLSVSLRAPYGLGEHFSRWFLMNPNGQTFGQELYVFIEVGTFEDKTPTPAG